MGVRCAVLLASYAMLLTGLGRPASAQVVWQLDNLTSIGGNDVSVTGDPQVVSTPYGDGLQFDGNDGIIVDANPIVGANQFTMEMLFRPDPIVNLSSNQPRIFHVQSNPSPPDHRAILEGRITEDNESWYLDTFLLSQRADSENPTSTTSLALIDPEITHPIGEWYSYSMVYDGSEVRAYVNQQLDISGDLEVLGLADGHTSLGMRINARNFFEGVIAQVRFTTSALEPEELLSPVLEAVPGDYDGNGFVEPADYDQWVTDFGMPVELPGEGADGNGDGRVNAADYVVWRNRVVTVSNGTATSIPEPATTWLIAVLAGLFSVVWREFPAR